MKAMKMGGMRKPNSDRISCLPEVLIHHIFTISSFTTKEVVQMSVLSKKWRNFWKSLPFIRIENENSQLYWIRSSSSVGAFNEKFITFVNKVITFYDESNLQTFYLEDEHGSGPLMGKDDDGLIDFFIRCNVQEIRYLRSVRVSKSAIICLFNQNSLRSLELGKLSIIDDEEEDVWSEKDDIVEVNPELNVTTSSMENLVLNSTCGCVNTMSIHGPKLKYLHINNDGHYLREIKIHAPALLQISLSGGLFHDFSLENTLSLVDINLDLTIRVCDVNKHFKRFSKFLKALVSAKSFTFNTLALEPFSQAQGLQHVRIPDETLGYFLNPVQASFLNIKYVKVTSWDTSLYIHTLAKFIEKFSSMETLFLKNNLTYEYERGNDKNLFWPEFYDTEDYETKDDDEGAARARELDERDWDDQLAFECCFCKLKSVEIEYFQGHKHEMTFIDFLMRSAPVLEKININTIRSLSEHKPKLLKYSEKLHSLPSYSPSVTISFG